MSNVSNQFALSRTAMRGQNPPSQRVNQQQPETVVNQGAAGIEPGAAKNPSALAAETLNPGAAGIGAIAGNSLNTANADTMRNPYGQGGMSLNELLGRMQAGGKGKEDIENMTSQKESYRKLRERIEALLEQADAARQNNSPDEAANYLQKAMGEIASSRQMLNINGGEASTKQSADRFMMESGLDHLTSMVGQRLGGVAMNTEGRFSMGPQSNGDA